jgi:Sulfotransferase domain
MLSGKQKVFGLGLSKTGTSSLTEALNILGMKLHHLKQDADYLATHTYRSDLLFTLFPGFDC